MRIYYTQMHIPKVSIKYRIDQVLSNVSSKLEDRCSRHDGVNEIKQFLRNIPATEGKYAVRNFCVLATHSLHNFYILFSSISEL